MLKKPNRTEAWAAAILERGISASTHTQRYHRMPGQHYAVWTTLIRHLRSLHAVAAAQPARTEPPEQVAAVAALLRDLYLLPEYTLGGLDDIVVREQVRTAQKPGAACCWQHMRSQSLVAVAHSGTLVAILLCQLWNHRVMRPDQMHAFSCCLRLLPAQVPVQVATWCSKLYKAWGCDARCCHEPR